MFVCGCLGGLARLPTSIGIGSGPVRQSIGSTLSFGCGICEPRHPERRRPTIDDDDTIVESSSSSREGRRNHDSHDRTRRVQPRPCVGSSGAITCALRLHRTTPLPSAMTCEADVASESAEEDDQESSASESDEPGSSARDAHHSSSAATLLWTEHDDEKEKAGQPEQADTSDEASS